MSWKNFLHWWPFVRGTHRWFHYFHNLIKMLKRQSRGVPGGVYDFILHDARVASLWGIHFSCMTLGHPFQLHYSGAYISVALLWGIHFSCITQVHPFQLHYSGASISVALDPQWPQHVIFLILVLVLLKSSVQCLFTMMVEISLWCIQFVTIRMTQAIIV